MTLAAGRVLLEGADPSHASIDILTGQIEFYVLAAEAGAQGWLDAQFGQGTVTLQGRLQRVGQP